jgi:predicted nucleotidyltransferase
MATIQLPPDFKEFLRLLNSSEVEYLVIGGYAVNYYGYARATADLDIWIGITPENAETAARAVREFGFAQADAATFLEPGTVIRMGVPPVRLEILTTISGVEFAGCYGRRHQAELDGVRVNFIRLDDLKLNKEASGRLKDRLDLEQLR